MKGNRFGIVMLFLLFFISLGVGIYTIVQPPPKPDAKAEEVTAPSFTSIFGNISGKDDKDGIGIVKIYGPIYTRTDEPVFTLESHGADRVSKKIRELGRNKHCKGILLRVNSPGGSIGASQEILDAVKDIKAEHELPIVVSMGDICASGGYYVSAAANKIVANSGTITGSIGVFVGNINFAELANKHGVKLQLVKSGEFKDILSSWREMTEAERNLLQELVDDCYQQFLNVVSEGRNIPLNELRKIADGRIFTGMAAKKHNLVDELGTYHDAVEILWDLTGLDGEPHILKESKEPFDIFMDILEGKSEKAPKSLTDLALGVELPKYVPVSYLYPGCGL